MKTVVVNGKEMTREELLKKVENLRARDLIERYLIPNGIKYSGSKTSLKESKRAVIDRMLKHFGFDEEEQVEAVQQEATDAVVQKDVQQEATAEFTDTKQEVNQDDDSSETPMSDEESDLIETLKDFAEIYPEITVEEIGYRSYELYRGEEFVGVVTPCRDTVIVASVAVESVGYDKIVDKITEIIG